MLQFHRHGWILNTYQMAKAELEFLQQLLGLHPGPRRGACNEDPVLVCIDCEAWEEDHSKITELGIAVLDPRDLVGLDPSLYATQWTAKVGAVHLRPLEYASLVNRKYVKGREEFFNFGTTYWIDLDKSTIILERLFKMPTMLEAAITSSASTTSATRPIVLVAHDMRSDLRFMDQLGFSLSRAENVIRRIDTQTVAGATKKNKIGLQRLLYGLDLQSTNLHNAGNDAVYTLQSLIVMAVKDFQVPGSVSRALQQVRRAKLPLAAVDDSNPAAHVRVGLPQKQSEQDDPPATLEQRSTPGADSCYSNRGGSRKRSSLETELYETVEDGNSRSKRPA